ncbi:uncharacterized protein SOCE26_048540 [Sorangium cellulosum]|uniref:Uncharacterized protein n=1 Tax=Sorangium cellulosum TaxID=56 RepID=A0A2L0EVT4_SORCE|nr:hypothetical protein [Sorangium cellulosum]AUX43406.1 uncharacterized protein SOCE26_048540 [Sorangium cellulosum]
MHCPLCTSPLAYIHGHAACVNSRCPLFGANQAECCTGETAESCPAAADDGASPRAPAETPAKRAR